MLNGWEFVISLILVGVFMWSCISLLLSGGLIFKTRKVRGQCRNSDIISTLIIIVAGVVSGILLFVYPGWIYQIPGVVVTSEIAIGTTLFYLTERQILNWKKLTRSDHHHPPKHLHFR